MHPAWASSQVYHSTIQSVPNVPSWLSALEQFVSGHTFVFKPQVVGLHSMHGHFATLIYSWVYYWLSVWWPIAANSNEESDHQRG